MLVNKKGASVVARFEDHASHPGVHVHSDCIRSGDEIGSTSMDNLVRIPSDGQYHRRVQAHTKDSFWQTAIRFFHINYTEPDFDSLNWN
jgi:hypothetical protein